MGLENKTGLELMQMMLNGDIPPPPMSSTIPMKGVSVEEGKVVFEVQADERHINVFGGVHGGFAASVLDSTTGTVIHTMLEAGVNYATIDLAIKMCRPVPLNQPLLAEGLIINVSKSLGVSQATLKDKQGKLFAHATATCMLLRS
ncbi:MAG: PaaI family thioesterase [Ghiorsea sp.]